MSHLSSVRSSSVFACRSIHVFASLLALLLLAPFVESGALAREWYVAPNGVSSNDGSRQRPLDLATAIGGSSPVRPGDTIWLLGGTYRGNFTSELRGGAVPNQIVVRGYPGERAILDGVTNTTQSVLTVGGSDTWFRDFEVTNSDPQRLSPVTNGSRGTGVNIFGARIKGINLIIHDTGLGYGLWSSAVDSEAYGSIIYNIGWEDPGQGTGHSIYAQNATGTQRLTDNILFNGFSFGIHAYTQGGRIDNMNWQGNVAFNHGVLSQKSGAKANFLLGGGQQARNPYIVDNFLYQSPNVGGRHFEIGYGGATCINPTILNNYVVGSDSPWPINCTGGTISGNKVFGNVASSVKAAWPSNEYFATQPTSGLVATVRKNQYEDGRGHVIIYNWDKLPQVNVNIAAIGLQPGDVFEVRDAQDYFNGPVMVGTYSSPSITLPMTGLTAAQPIGNAPLRAPHTPVEFGVFVVKKVSGTLSNLAPAATLVASPKLIATGESSTLTWSTALATSVSIDQGIGAVAATGTLTVSPASSRTYTLTATNAQGTSTSTATVDVASAGTATFIRSDTTSNGNWIGRYGADGYKIAQEGTSLPGYATVNFVGAGDWVWNANTSDPRALQKSTGSGRIAAQWYSGNTLFIDVAITDGARHTIGLYMYDWDRYDRNQTIEVLDGVTERVLDTRTVGPFYDGRYLFWEITQRIRFRITNNTSPNATISGIFFDGPGGGPSAPPTTPQPTATFSANPTTIAPGGSSSLSWTTTDATTVTIDQGIGTVAANGSMNVTPAQTTTYTLTAQNTAGTVSKQVTVGMTTAPSVTFSATSSISAGQSATLAWSTTNATSVSINQGVGAVATSGTKSVSPATTTTYVLTASNAAGPTTASATVTVVPAPTANLTVNSPITAGQSATLSWSTTNATSISINQGVGTVSATGTKTVSPATTTTYVLTATNSAGTSVTSTATLTVYPPGNPGTAQFLRTDAVTQGSWRGVYGTEGYSLAQDAQALPAYASLSLTGSGNWTWNASTTDLRALQKPTGTARVAAQWFAGNSFNIDLTITDGRSHQVALYFFDWDRYGRSETIEVIDLITGRVLDTRTAGPAPDGRYLIWEVSQGVRFKVTNTGYPNATLSGIFFDPAGLAAPTQPAASLSVSPATVGPGKPATLSWSTTNANTVSIDQGIGAVSATGTQTVNPTVTTTYTLTAQNPAGIVTRQATVTVIPLPTASISINSPITAGQSATLSWSTTNATLVSIDQGVGVVSTSGTKTVTPGATTTYTITATNAAGSTTANASITVNAGSTTPPPPTGGTAAAQFLRTDTVTKGYWRGTYGADGYAVAQDGTSLPAYAQMGMTGQGNWVWSSNTSDVRALQKSGGIGQIASQWYGNGASFSMDVTITDGKTHSLALYVLDWDSPYRVQTIDVLDATTNAVLDTRSVSSFQGGTYLVWQVSGKVRFRLTKTSGANATLSGVFFDTSGGGPAVPSNVQFVRTDTTTKGNWRSGYGADGYSIAQESTSLPAYAQVARSGYGDYIWNAAPTDARALLRGSGSGSIAAQWYGSTSFLIDVTITDGQTHPVSLYLLDWDSPNRIQTVDVIDLATGAVKDTRTVSSFTGGQYLTWQISGKVRFRITRTAGANATASGIFFGAP